jgi:hypothetical protein
VRVKETYLERYRAGRGGGDADGAPARKKSRSEPSE